MITSGVGVSDVARGVAARGSMVVRGTAVRSLGQYDCQLLKTCGWKEGSLTAVAGWSLILILVCLTFNQVNQGMCFCTQNKRQEVKFLNLWIPIPRF